MEQTNSMKINNKVFSEENIVELCKQIDKIYQKDIEQKEKTSVQNSFGYMGKLSITLECSDQTSYSGDYNRMVADQYILKNKKVETLRIDFMSQGYDKFIKVDITEKKHYPSQAVVRGTDSNWVNASTQTIKDIIEHAKPQENFILKYKRILVFLTSLVISFLTVFTVVLVLAFLEKLGLLNIKPSNNNGIIFLSVLIGLASLLWSFWLDKQIDELWPSIEFNFGPEHFQKAKLKRRVYGIFITMILLPLLFLILGKIL